MKSQGIRVWGGFIGYDSGMNWVNGLYLGARVGLGLAGAIANDAFIYGNNGSNGNTQNTPNTQRQSSGSSIFFNADVYVGYNLAGLQNPFVMSFVLSSEYHNFDFKDSNINSNTRLESWAAFPGLSLLGRRQILPMSRRRSRTSRGSAGKRWRQSPGKMPSLAPSLRSI